MSRRLGVSTLIVLAAFAMMTVAAGPSRAGDTEPSPAPVLPLPEHDPDEARSAARNVLDRPEFDRPAPTLLQRIRTWVIERVEQALGALLGKGSAQLLAWLVLVAGLAVVVFLVIRFSRGMTPDAARRVEEPIERRRTPAEWRAEAEAHARAGRWREAVRFRYRALVSELGARGLVDDVPGRTAGEYRREVAGRVPGVAATFDQASDLFEQAWYGRRPTAEEQDARLRELSDSVLSGAT